MTDKILHRLLEDHRQLNNLLLVLERQLQGISRHDRPDYELMYQILHYLTHYPDRFHHVFEDLLFERLVSRRPEMKYIQTVLHDQHTRLIYKGTVLRSMINDVLNGVTVVRSELLDSGRDYLLEYQEHLAREETQIFPQLVQTLTMSEWVTLTTKFAWNIDPLFSSEVSSEYRLLAQRLQLMGADVDLMSDDQRQSCAACSDDNLRNDHLC